VDVIAVSIKSLTVKAGVLVSSAFALNIGTLPAICVDSFPLRQELDSEFIQLVENLQEVLGASGQAVTGPNDDDIKAVPLGVFEHLVEGGSPRFCAADAMICVLFNDLESALTSEVPEFVELVLRVLVHGGDSHVKCSTLHGNDSFSLRPPIRPPL
jgi:hypothetical protein